MNNQKEKNNVLGTDKFSDWPETEQFFFLSVIDEKIIVYDAFLSIGQGICLLYTWMFMTLELRLIDRACILLSHKSYDNIVCKWEEPLSSD